MPTVSAPARLRVATFLTLLSVPMAAVEVGFVSRALWWNLPIRKMELWSGLVLLLVTPLVMAIWRGRRLAFYLLILLTALWCLSGAVMAIHFKNFWHGIFVLFLSAFWIALLSLIHTEISRSFFDPRLTWYQGLPKPIPGLTCQVDTEGQQDFRVSRLDHDGTFIYVADRSQGVKGFKAGVALDIRFEFENRKVVAKGIPIRILDSHRGIGLKFHKMSPDEKKELGDFVEALRGKGYVS
jgi:hypothetical protein